MNKKRLSLRERGIAFLGLTSMLKIHDKWPHSLKPHLPKMLEAILSLLASIRKARQGEEVKRESNCRNFAN